MFIIISKITVLTGIRPVGPGRVINDKYAGEITAYS